MDTILSKIFYVLLILLLLTSITGCTAVKQVGNELGSCLAKCKSVCDSINQTNLDMENYNVGLSKTSGSMTVSCSCPCG